MSKQTGGCHCGAIKFKSDLDPMMVGKCNCERCRRLTGTFAVAAFYSEDEIIIEGGTAELTELDRNWLNSKLVQYGMLPEKGVDHFTKIVAGKQLWNYDNLEPNEKKLIL